MNPNFKPDAWRPIPKSWRKKRRIAPVETTDDFRARLRAAMGPAPRTELQKLVTRGPNDRGYFPPKRKNQP
jgi:hypothetical protein